MLNNRHEEFENGSAYNAAEAIHSILSEREGRECLLLLQGDILTKLVKALTPVLGSAHVDTAYAAAGSIQKLLDDEAHDSLGRRRILALPLASLRALTMSFTPLLGSPHEETASAAFFSVRRLLDAPEGVGLLLAALRDDALGALVKGLTPLLSAGAGRTPAQRCSAAQAIRKIMEEGAGRRRVLTALPEEDSLMLLTQLVLLLGAGRSDVETLAASAATLRFLTNETVGRKRILSLGEETFALLVRRPISPQICPQLRSHPPPPANLPAAALYLTHPSLLSANPSPLRSAASSRCCTSCARRRAPSTRT